MKLKELIGKNQEGKKISLYYHSIEVAEKSVELFDMLGIKDEDLRWMCYVTGLLHDIGKCSEDFQKHIIGETIDYPYHNVLGSFIVKYLINFGGVKKYNENILRDKTKIELCKKNSIKLLHFTFNKKSVPENFTEYNVITDIDELIKVIKNE